MPSNHVRKQKCLERFQFEHQTSTFERVFPSGSLWLPYCYVFIMLRIYNASQQLLSNLNSHVKILSILFFIPSDSFWGEMYTLWLNCVKYYNKHEQIYWCCTSNWTTELGLQLVSHFNTTQTPTKWIRGQSSRDNYKCKHKVSQIHSVYKCTQKIHKYIPMHIWIHYDLYDFFFFWAQIYFCILMPFLKICLWIAILLFRGF